MSPPKQSLSQLFTSFGPGAMMDLPTRSVVVAGLDHWDSAKVAFKTIDEPRLTTLLYTVLSQTGRWEPGRPVQLRTPPIAQENRNDFDPAGVAVRVFPTWFTCEGITVAGAANSRRRRLVRWTELDAAGGRKRFQREEDGKKVDVAPIRFVAACKKGHLQDIDWKWLVHRGAKCDEPMWIEEQGTSADPANIRIGCLCERPSVSLADAFKPGFLGTCKGNRPWLDNPERDCPGPLHFLSRSATNTYFPQAVTIISLPIHEDELSQAIRKNWTSLQAATDPNFIGVLKNVPEIGASIGPYANEDVYARIVQLREAIGREATQDPKVAEFDLLGSGAPIIGIDAAREPLFANTLDIPDIERCATDDGPLLDSVVAVHRLRAVTCLYGFTRLEPAPTFAENMLEDVRIAVDGAPLSEAADWLPAMEQFGEGIFIKIRPQAVRGWLLKPAVQARGDVLETGIRNYAARHGVIHQFPGLPYILLHSLSHALMEEIALDCGYPLSSLKERVYAILGNGTDRPDRLGILIYTASSGAQGTLGGLTAAATCIPMLIQSAFERLRLCSNDPVCADHDPSVAGDERSLLGAACHACVLVPETSCESRNSHLDRALLVETIAGTQAHLAR